MSPRPRDAEMKHKADLDAMHRKRDLEEIIYAVESSRVSPRLASSLDLTYIEDLSDDQIEYLRRVLGMERSVEVTVTPPQLQQQSSPSVDMSGVVNEIKAQLSSLVPEIVKVVKEAGIGSVQDVVNTIDSNRPTIEKVFIDPSDNKKVNSNIKDIGKVKTGDNINEQLEKFKALKKKKGKDK